MLVVYRADEAAELHDGAAGRVPFLYAADLHTIEIVAFVAGAIDTAPFRPQVGADVRNRRAARGDSTGVFERQRLAAPLLRCAVAAEAAVELEDDQSIRTEAADDAGNGAVEAGDDGAYTDDSAGADDDTQDGQEGTQFMLADGGEGQARSGSEGEEVHSSARRASIGSSWAARRAG